MKILKVFVSVVLLSAVIIAFDSCKGKGGDPDPEPETEVQRVTKLLTSGQWMLKSLTIDGVAKDSYAGLTITFTSSGFTATNGAPVWPANGAWQFNDDTAKALKRGDQTVVAIESIDDKNLTLSLTWAGTFGPGRISSVDGKHVFVMSR